VRPTPTRAELDLLKATLHNCARHGPASQNRDGHPDLRAHLRGRVAWFERVHPAKGARLRAMFDQIAW
jgi:RNA-directed DNA polymerase